MSNNASKAAPRSWLREELPYILPMAVFMVLVWAGGRGPWWYVSAYYLKTLVVGALLLCFWKRYTKVRWDYWWLGVIVGIVGIVQWVGMEKTLMHYWPNYPRIPGSADVFNPYEHFTSPAAMWSFIITRWFCATVVVAFMEELFWRDYLWRLVIAPSDFKLAAVGEWNPAALAVVTVLFASVHPQWMTALVWGLMVGGLLLWTRSLGACIIAHGVTNLLLGAYVQWGHLVFAGVDHWLVPRQPEWFFW